MNRNSYQSFSHDSMPVNSTPASKVETESVAIEQFCDLEAMEPRILLSTTPVGFDDFDAPPHYTSPSQYEALEYVTEIRTIGDASIIHRFVDRLDRPGGSQSTTGGGESMMSSGGITINIDPGSALAANQDAYDAFVRAAAQWEAFIQDSIVINIYADFDILGSGILGETLLTRVVYSYTDIRDAMVDDSASDPDDGIVSYLPTMNEFSAFIPSGFWLEPYIAPSKANLKALGFDAEALDQAHGVLDGEIFFNSSFDFDFDNSDGIDFGHIDFETVAAHEIGHVLGFLSDLDRIDGEQSGFIVMTPLDLYRFADGGTYEPTTETEFTNFPREFRHSEDSNFNDIDNQWAMSTGVISGDDQQASHWKDQSFTGDPIGIMVPAITAEQIVAISYADKRAFDLIGYDIDLTPPTAVIETVTVNQAYDARTTGINSIDITFSEEVLGFDIDDIVLLRNSQAVDLSSATLTNSGDDIHFTLEGLVELTSFIGGQGVLWGLHDYELRVVAGDSGITDVWGNAMVDDAVETWAARIRRADLNGDGKLNTEDINPFILALTDMSTYQQTFPDIWGAHVGDYTGENLVNTEDINYFIDDLTSTEDNEEPGESLMGGGPSFGHSRIASYIYRMVAAIEAGHVDVLALLANDDPFSPEQVDALDADAELSTAADLLAA